MPYLALTNLHDMSAPEARKALHAAWTMAEWPLLAAPADVWTSAFRWATRDGGYLHDDDERPLDDLPETIRVYRGASTEGALSMSWSSEPAIAAWFAARGMLAKSRAYVWRADVTRDEVLARYTSGRGESEYVLDLEGWELRHLTRLTAAQAREENA